MRRDRPLLKLVPTIPVSAQLVAIVLHIRGVVRTISVASHTLTLTLTLATKGFVTGVSYPLLCVSTPQELDLLRNTPAQQLLRVDALRAEACATRIQRFWRRARGPQGVSRLCESGATDKAPVTGCMENHKHSLTAPEISSRRCQRYWR